MARGGCTADCIDIMDKVVVCLSMMPTLFESPNYKKSNRYIFSGQFIFFFFFFLISHFFLFLFRFFKW